MTLVSLKLKTRTNLMMEKSSDYKSVIEGNLILVL